MVVLHNLSKYKLTVQGSHYPSLCLRLKPKGKGLKEDFPIAVLGESVNNGIKSCFKTTACFKNNCVRYYNTIISVDFINHCLVLMCLILLKSAILNVLIGNK